MLRRLTLQEKEEILRLKEKGKYTVGKSQEKNGHRTKIHKLADAWMTYIDMLDLDRYNSKHFTAKNNDDYCDKIFSYGEIGAITRYLLEHNKIEKDPWGRYKVKWREDNETGNNCRREEKNIRH